jgi:hypothetical protein
VDQQREQLVQSQPLLPAGGERVHRLVAGDDAGQVGEAEQVQHGDVHLAVSAVAGRVHGVDLAVGAPHAVAVPQVAVQP